MTTTTVPTAAAEPPLHEWTASERALGLDKVDNKTAPKRKPIPTNPCSICTLSLPCTSFPPSRNLTPNCSHIGYSDTEGFSDAACTSCISLVIKTAIHDRGSLTPCCPFCNQGLSFYDIQKFADKETLERYQYLLDTRHPDMRYCLVAGCGSRQIHAMKGEPMMLCQKCAGRTCVVHDVPWHDGLTCEEYDGLDSQVERSRESMATAKLLTKRNVKICPHCKQGVEKTGGCNIMSCTCNTIFCYICLADWSNFDQRHRDHRPACTEEPEGATKAQKEAGKKAQETKMLQSVFGGTSELLDAVQEKSRQEELQAAQRRLEEKARIKAEKAAKAQKSGLRRLLKSLRLKFSPSRKKTQV